MAHVVLKTRSYFLKLLETCVCILETSDSGGRLRAILALLCGSVVSTRTRVVYITFCNVLLWTSANTHDIKCLFYSSLVPTIQDRLLCHLGLHRQHLQITSPLLLSLGQKLGHQAKTKQEAHVSRFAHLSDLATADMQMLCNIFPILSSQLMKIHVSSFEQFLVLKKNIWA